jgi:hypothetical protein
MEMVEGIEDAVQLCENNSHLLSKMEEDQEETPIRTCLAQLRHAVDFRLLQISPWRLLQHPTGPK